MSDEPSEMTALDEALQIARQDATQANFFYDAFLNAVIYVPALRSTQKPGEWEKIKTTERFFPLYLRKGEERAVPVFDTLDKLKAWAGERAFDYLALQAHLFLRAIAPEIALILNDGTPWRYEFPPDILERLREAMRPVDPV